MLILGPVFAAIGCGKGGASGSRSKSVDPEVEAAATSRIAELQLAYTALAKAPKNLPTCTPKADISVLSLNTASSVLTGKGQGIPDFASPSFDDFFWRKVKVGQSADEHRRGVQGLKQLAAIGLFEATIHVAPVAIGTDLKPGHVAGRAVVFDLQGVPTCQLAIDVSGPAKVSAMVDNSKSYEDRKRALQYNAAEKLKTEVSQAVTDGIQTKRVLKK